jgi:hypothetical protein
MPTTVLINAVPGTLPSNFCPTGATALQEFYNEIIARTVFSLSPDKAFYNFGDTTPTPENRVFPWLRTISGSPDRWYVYVGGKWIWPYRVPSGNAEWIIWPHALNLLYSYDGGDGTDPTTTAPTSTTGSFWERATEVDARFLVGMGTLPSGTIINPASTGGEEKHILSIAELPAHTHGPASDTGPGYFATFKSDYSADNLGNEGVTDQANQQLVGSRALTGSTGSGDAHNNMPPYYGVVFAKRTVREFYTAT